MEVSYTTRTIRTICSECTRAIKVGQSSNHLRIKSPIVTVPVVAERTAVVARRSRLRRGARGGRRGGRWRASWR